MRQIACFLGFLVFAAPLVAQRPSDPALLVPEAAAELDYVFAPVGSEVMRAEIIRTARAGRLPSDHFPVIAEIRLPIAK